MEDLLQRAIRKLELNENAVSTILGGVVMLVVAFLFFNYFSNGDFDPKHGEVAETIETQGTIGQVSSTATSKYVVAEGESLWMIAEASYGDGNKWTEIARVNGLANADDIESGMELDIPRIGDFGPGYVAGSEDNQQADSQIDSSKYIVQRGDYLSLIAQRVYNNKDRWIDIWNANKDIITNPNNLEEGLELTIPE